MSGKLKKANKGGKGQDKDQRVDYCLLKIFFMFLGSFDVNSFMISLFLSFKAIKAKKAAHLARNAKLDRWIDIFPKMLF